MGNTCGWGFWPCESLPGLGEGTQLAWPGSLGPSRAPQGQVAGQSGPSCWACGLCFLWSWSHPGLACPCSPITHVCLILDTLPGEGVPRHSAHLGPHALTVGDRRGLLSSLLSEWVSIEWSSGGLGMGVLPGVGVPGWCVSLAALGCDPQPVVGTAGIPSQPGRCGSPHRMALPSLPQGAHVDPGALALPCSAAVCGASPAKGRWEGLGSLALRWRPCCSFPLSHQAYTEDM